MKFLGSLGIDIKLLIAQIINFGLLLWLLKKFLYKPIVDQIEKDELELKKNQAQAEVLEQEKTALEEKSKKEVAEAKSQAQQIIKEAEDIAEEIKKRSQKETEKEKTAVIKQIRSRLSEIKNEENHKK